MKKKKQFIIGTLLLSPILILSQVGISNSNPQGTFHVDGAKDNSATGTPTAVQQSNDLVVTNAGNIGIGTTTPATKLEINNGTTAGAIKIIDGTQGANKILTSDANGVATWQTFAGGTPSANGSVIAIDGKFLIAQEIKLQMSADFTISTTGVTFPIGNLNNEIIDNENKYIGTSTGNSFTVSEDGIYEIIMNAQLILAVNNQPVIGIWDDTDNNWVARINDIAATTLQTYTLITSIPMLSSHTYSFRVASTTGNVTVKRLSTGTSGNGPVTQVSLKRLR